MSTEPAGNPVSDILQIHRNLRRSPEAISILLVNLMILTMVIFLKPDRYIVIGAYFLETLIIGIFNVIKMIIISLFSPVRSQTPNLFPQLRRQGGSYSSFRMNLYLIVFFILHFSIFYFVQLALLTGAADGMDEHFPVQSTFLPNPVTFFKVALGGQGIYIVLAIVGVQLFTLVYSFLIRGEYKVTNCLRQAMQPYGRIILQQLVVLIGGFFIIIVRNAAVFSVFLIIIKTFFDVYAQKRHDKSVLKRMEDELGSTDTAQPHGS